MTGGGGRAAAFAAFAAFGAFWGGWAVLLPEIKAQTGASLGGLGLALLAAGLAALPAMLVTGFLIDRLGRGLLGGLLLAFGALAVLPGLAPSVGALALALVLVGAVSGSLDVAANVRVSALEAAHAASLMQRAHALFSAGFLVTSVAVGVARGAGAGAVPVLLTLGALLVLAGLANLRFREADAAPTRARARLRGSRPLLLLGSVCAVAFVVEGGIESWSALFLEEGLGASPALAGLGPGLFAAAMTAGRALADVLEARFGDRELLAGGSLLAAAGLAAAAGAPGVPVALAGLFVGGAGISVAAPILFGAGGRTGEAAERGNAVASVTTLGYVGALVGPPVIGGVSEALGLRAGFLFLALVAAALGLGTASFAADALPLRRLQRPSRG